jgi:hypothetical protein
MTAAQDGGKVVSLTHRPPLPPGLTWYSFLEAESTPGHMELSDAKGKTPATPGIDPGTFRLVAQCLKHYATPGPSVSSSGINVSSSSSSSSSKIIIFLPIVTLRNL